MLLYVFCNTLKEQVPDQGLLLHVNTDLQLRPIVILIGRAVLRLVVLSRDIIFP